MVKSTRDLLSMCDPATSPGSPSAISSPGSGDGVTPSASPDGPTIDPCGRAPVPVNRSHMQASDKGSTITVISGTSGTGSFASVALTRSLANRLQRALATDGLIVFRQTWKELVTPSGRVYWAHIASAPLTSDNVSGLSRVAIWKTPNCPRQRDTETTVGRAYASKQQEDLADQVVAVIGGETLNGSNAPIRSDGQLSPEHPRWLMGYPREWSIAAQVTDQSVLPFNINE